MHTECKTIAPSMTRLLQVGAAKAKELVYKIMVVGNAGTGADLYLSFATALMSPTGPQC